jgi:type III pantothenate kinase
MLLAIDAGNTDIKYAFFAGAKLLGVVRVPTRDIRFTYEHFDRIEQFVAEFNDQDAEGVIISCVTDWSAIGWLPEKFSRLTPMLVDHTMKTGLTILYDDPSQLGSDRLVDSVAAVEKYGAPCVVLDFGTATTFNAINAERAFLGGMIVPGIMTAFKALTNSTENLRPLDVEFMWPNNIIGRSTYESLQSGLFFGTIDMIDGLIKRILNEMDGPPKVIATGGLARLMEGRSHCIEVFDERLTLDGLRIIYDLNKA